jgi:hypothetical protein
MSRTTPPITDPSGHMFWREYRYWSGHPKHVPETDIDSGRYGTESWRHVQIRFPYVAAGILGVASLWLARKIERFQQPGFPVRIGNGADADA